MPKNTLFLSDDDFNSLLQILANIPYKIYVYGSRSRGNPKKFSDIDLYIDGDVSDEMLSSLKEKFDLSDLPMKVDILTPKHCSEHFLNLIRKEMQILK